MFQVYRKELIWGGRPLVLETGKLARQAESGDTKAMDLESQLRGEWELQQGQVFRNGNWDSAKAQTLAALPSCTVKVPLAKVKDMAPVSDTPGSPSVMSPRKETEVAPVAQLIEMPVPESVSPENPTRLMLPLAENEVLPEAAV